MRISAVSRRTVAAVVAVVALLAFACNGGGDGESATPTVPPAPTPSPTGAAKIAFVDPDGNLAVTSGDGGGQRTLTSGGGVQRVTWSPDGSLLALEGEDIGVRVVDTDGGAVFDVEGASKPVWSPQSDHIIVAKGVSLLVFDRSGKQVLEVADAGDAAVAVWSPDGQKLAFLRGDADSGYLPVLLPLAGGDESPLSDLIEARDQPYPLAWHPDGTAIAYFNGIYPVGGGNGVSLPGVPVSWSPPDGRILFLAGEHDPAAGSARGLLLDMNSGGQQIIGLEIRPASDGTAPWWHIQRYTAWSPNGRVLVYLDPHPQRFRVRVYDTVDVTQKMYAGILGQWPSASPETPYVVFTQEGKVWLLSIDGTVLRNLAEGSFAAWQPAPQG
jgi:WD40 repeat protein